MFGFKLLYVFVITIFIFCIIEIKAGRKQYNEINRIRSDSKFGQRYINGEEVDEAVGTGSGSNENFGNVLLSQDEYDKNSMMRRRRRRNSTTTTMPTTTQLPTLLRKYRGLRRRRLWTLNESESDIDRLTRRVPTSIMKKTLDLELDDNNSSTRTVSIENNEPEQGTNRHPSFINYDEFLPVVNSDSHIEIDDTTTNKPVVTSNPKPSKKYYPVFRKKSTTLTTLTSASNENTSSDLENLKVFIKNRNNEIHNNSKIKTSLYRVTSKVNPNLFSLRNVSDLDRGESVNPFLDGGGAGAPFSLDLGGRSDYSNNLKSLHSLLNSDSVPFSHVIPIVEENTTDPTTTTQPSTTLEINPTTISDDLQTNDEIRPTISDILFPTTTTIGGRIRKKSPSLGSTLGASQDFLHGLTIKKCNPTIISVSTTTNPNNSNNNISLQTSESIKSSIRDDPITITSTEPVTTATTDKDHIETTTTGVTDPSTTFTDLPLDTIVVMLADDPGPPITTTVSASSPVTTFTISTTTGENTTLASTSPSSTTTETTSQPTTSEVSNKVQRHTITEPSSVAAYPNVVAPESNNLGPGLFSTSTPTPSPYESILSLFQPLTLAPRPQQQQDGKKSSPTTQPIVNGLFDSLNSIYNLLGVTSPSTSTTNSLTTPFPLPISTTTGFRPIPTATNSNSLQNALSNMISVLTNPFSDLSPAQTTPNFSKQPQSSNTVSNILTLDSGIPSPVIRPTTQKPIVPLNPSDYLNQLLQLGADLGITQNLVQQGQQQQGQQQKETSRQVSQQHPSPPPPSQNYIPRQIPTTIKPLTFDFSSLFSNNLLSGFLTPTTTTPAPSSSFDLLSLLTRNFPNPFAAFTTLTTTRPNLFSGSASNQLSNIFGQGQQQQPNRKNGLYYWLDMNTFLPGQDTKTNPTTGIRPKLGQKDYFYKVRR